MAQAGPYGITQVDVPGVLGVYQAAQENRIRQMLLKRQVDKEEREAKTQTGIRDALSRYSGRKGAETAPQPEQGDAGTLRSRIGMSDPVSAYGAPPATPQPAASTPATQRRPTAADREELFGSLLALDPQTAGQVMDAFGKMDKAQAESAAQRSAVLGRGAQHLMSVPREQRAAELQRIAPDLLQAGISQDKIAGFDPTDDNALSFIVNQSRDIEKIIEGAQPKIQPVTQGGSVLSIDPRTGSAKTIYESPTVEGPGGDVYARPPEMSTMQPRRVTNAQEYEALPPGAEYIDPNGNRRTKGGAPATTGAATFP